MSTPYDSVFLSRPFRPTWTAAPEYREGAMKTLVRIPRIVISSGAS